MKTLSNGTLLVACMGGVLGSGSLATAGISGYSFEMSNVSQSGWLVPDARDLVTVDIYMNFENSTDHLEAVYGTAANPLNLTTDDASGFFQSANGSADTAADFNEALIAINPSMAADSWVTIARASSTDNNLLNIGIDFTAFNAGGALSVVNGSWFVTPVDIQGSAGDARCYRILLARMSVASGSTVSGSFNLQYKEAGIPGPTTLDQAFSVTASTEALWVSSANVNDFDGNGTYDLIVRDCISGTNPNAVSAYLSTVGDGSPAYNEDGITTFNMNGWSSVGFGDFDGDGNSDLLWSNDSTGTFGLWLMDPAPWPATPYTTTAMAGTMSGYTPIGTGDFDANGTTDILYQEDATGGTEIWLMSAVTPGVYTQLSVYPTSPGADWLMRGVGDLDNDGDADILWQRSLTSATIPGAVACWLIDTSIVAPAAPYTAASIYGSGIPGWQIYGLCDWDADGDDDVIWKSDSVGNMATWELTGAVGPSVTYTPAAISLAETVGWDVIGFGDYNGDSHVDLMWQSQAAGTLAYWAMTSDPAVYTPVVYSNTDFNTEPLWVGNDLDPGD